MVHHDAMAPSELEPEPAAAAAAAAATARVAAAATAVAAPPAGAVLPRQWHGLWARDSWNELDFAPADLLAVAQMVGLSKADATVSDLDSWCSSEQAGSRGTADVDDLPACLS